MKKLIAISFLFIFLCTYTEIGQLLKLPVLIHHYIEHHEEDAGISFAGFLHKHYSETNSHASHNNEHEKLPFKSHDLGLSQSALAFYSPLRFEPYTFKHIPLKESIPYSERFYTASFLSRIWQPPKYC